MQTTNYFFSLVWCTLILLLSPFATNTAAERLLADTSYADAKGHFRIVPPKGWQIDKYPNDPRGKVAFVAGNVRLGVIVQADDMNSFEELMLASRQIEKRMGVSMNIRRTEFAGVPAIERSFIARGQKLISLSFLVGELTHNITYSAPTNLYERYVDIATTSIQTYEPLQLVSLNNDVSFHQAAKKYRLAEIMIGIGNLKAAQAFVDEGLEWSPDNKELRRLQQELIETQDNESAQ